jgi:uncharacterized protein YndB with AHSA1/START domain/GNAT superfamily N-acetyltransferase
MVPDGMTSHVHEFDAREGGAFRISLSYDEPAGTGKTTAQTETYHGHFLTLVRDEQVVEVMEFETGDPAMQGEMTVTFTLRELEGGTEILAVHDGLPPGLSPADNELGWRMSLDKLAALVESDRTGEYQISTDKRRLDIGVIHAFLTTSYWSPGIPRAVVERAIEGSLCFGVYRDDEQVGFARVVTDRATFGYLADVFILEPHRDRGLARRLVQTILAHPDLAGVRRFMLATQDAHRLYRGFGFAALAHPEHIMEISHADPYRKR